MFPGPPCINYNPQLKQLQTTACLGKKSQNCKRNYSPSKKKISDLQETLAMKKDDEIRTVKSAAQKK